MAIDPKTPKDQSLIMTEDEQAAAMETVSDAIMSAIANSGHQKDTTLIMGSLGAVVGGTAKDSGRPIEALRVMNRIAEGVISGELLDGLPNPAPQGYDRVNLAAQMGVLWIRLPQHCADTLGWSQFDKLEMAVTTTGELIIKKLL